LDVVVTVKADREELLAREDVWGADLRRALTALYDGWLAELLGDPGPGVALVAVGGLGRGDLVPGSDLDLVLVHDGTHDVGAIADRVWYPVWDEGIGLDHSVRTLDEAAAVAKDDLKAALGLLDARHVAGDEELSRRLVAALRASWRAQAPKRLAELKEMVDSRAATSGEVAFLLEPDLKESRGGLRDVHALQALAVAQLADPPSDALRNAAEVLLDVRCELHRRTGRAGRRTVDRLLMQEQDGVAHALGFGDADALMASVSAAGRVVAYASDSTWRRVTAAAPKRRMLGLRGPAGPVRRPLAEDVVEQDGEVVLARDATPEQDALLVLRVAAAAARARLPIAPITLQRLSSCPPLAQPWPAPALESLVSLLAAGDGAVHVFEELDHAGLLEPLLPEWAMVRSKPQRNSYHRFTVDRHLVETAAHAAALTRRVSRPDLLLLGALLHDIGKGLPGDHTEVGMEVVTGLAPRLGVAADDVTTLVDMVRHHLLLPDVATRRDLSDPATARGVADAVGSLEVLELLHALAEADSLATGPAAWSSWKAQLIAELVARASALLAGHAAPPPPALDEAQESVVARGQFALEPAGDTVLVVAPDRPGLLSMAAGVLALHRLDVRAASGFARGATAVTLFRVAPRFGALPDWTVVREDLRHTLEGTLDLAGRLAAREAAYARTDPLAAPSTVRLVDDASDTATVVEIRASDEMGVLHRITDVLQSHGLDVRSAHVSTLGADVVDAFYVPVLADPTQRESLVKDLLAVLP